MLGLDDKTLRVLVLFDGVQNGRPGEYRSAILMPRRHARYRRRLVLANGQRASGYATNRGGALRTACVNRVCPA